MSTVAVTPPFAGRIEPRLTPHVACRRALGFAAVFCVPVIVTWLGTRPAAYAAIHAVFDYSPSRLARGQVWLLPTSALKLPTHNVPWPELLVGMLMLPFPIVAGLKRTLIAFFVSHIGATLLSGLAVLALDALGVAGFGQLALDRDVGISAGLCGVAAAWCMWLRRRSRYAATGDALAVLLVAVFLFMLVVQSSAGHRLANVEHLIALGIGFTLGWKWFT